MINQLFAPDVLFIGFQKRIDAFNEKLAYVTYKDDNLKIFKNVSFSSWISNKIPKEEHLNLPSDGFIISTKEKQHFVSGKYETKIRIHDPRGYDIEISVSNLLLILSNCTIENSKIISKLIYAWKGEELFLIPVDSEKYRTMKNKKTP